MSHTPSFLVIDALNLIRRIYAVDELKSAPEHAVENAINRCALALKKLLRRLKPTHAVVVFDGEQSWRYHFYADYKASRKPMPTVLKNALPRFVAAFKDLGVSSYLPDNDEADDVIATFVAGATKHGISSTLVSTDKGFLTLLESELQIYDYFKGSYIDARFVHDKFQVAPSQLVDYLALVGDKTNDIPGVKGIGKKTAIKLLNQYGSVRHAVNSLANQDTDTQDDVLSAAEQKKLTAGLADYSRAKQLITLRQDLDLGISLKALRLSAE